MNEFHQKLVLAIVDKLPLLALAVLGAFATFKASKALETFKSAQAMEIELGKARAAAILRMLQSVSECRIKSVAILTEADADDCNDEKLLKLQGEFGESWRNLQGLLARERLLIGETTGSVAHSLGCAASELVTASFRIREQRMKRDGGSHEASRSPAAIRDDVSRAMREMESAAFLLERFMPYLNPRGPAKVVRRRLEEIRKWEFTLTSGAALGEGAEQSRQHVEGKSEQIVSTERTIPKG